VSFLLSVHISYFENQTLQIIYTQAQAENSAFFEAFYSAA